MDPGGRAPIYVPEIVGFERARGIDESPDAKPADSGFRKKARGVPILRSGNREHRLDRPQMTIGRSALSDIQVVSALVSRRHATLTISERGVAVEDHGSRNGVYLNAERVVGSAVLKIGDRLGIGDETLVFFEIDEPVAERATETVAAMQAARADRDGVSDEDQAVATRSADVFQLLGHVVDKALALGRGDEAEHLIAAHLHAAFADATSQPGLSPDIARTAAGYAVKIAGATGRAQWLDYALKLYGALDLVLPLALVDEMYVLLRRVRGIDLGVLRGYTEALRTRARGLAPAERFVLQRLIGLERLAAWQTGTQR
jgi:pSer/pThr/pTyr-binding forkhead associated (FHA) protein